MSAHPPDDPDRTLPFEKIVSKYERPIHAFILGQVDAPNEAEDLTQETFVIAHRAFPAVPRDCTVWIWLSRIAWEQVKAHLEERRSGG